MKIVRTTKYRKACSMNNDSSYNDIREIRGNFNRKGLSVQDAIQLVAQDVANPDHGISADFKAEEVSPQMGFKYGARIKLFVKDSYGNTYSNLYFAFFDMDRDESGNLVEYKGALKTLKPGQEDVL